MAGNRSAGGGVLETMVDFKRRRDREMANFGLQAEAAAHEAYRNAIRAKDNLVLRTQAEVNRFGAALLGAQKPRQVSAGATRAGVSSTAPRRSVVQPTRKPGPARSIAQQAEDQTLAGLRGAQDAFTLGLGDRAYAGARALVDASHGADLGAAWRSRMAAERARDADDARNYRVARTAGQVAGTGLGIVALGPLDAALAGGVRIAQAAPMVAREVAVLGGLGAGGGVVTQALTDVQRRRPGSVGDYVGSAAGGAALALASARGRPGQAGVIGGATTSVAQDVLNGRRVDWENTGEAALGSGYAAAPVGYMGRRYSNGLSPKQKGELGEALGRIRTRANFDKVKAQQVEFKSKNGGGRHTKVDHITDKEVLTEQKFGMSIRKLSRMQQAAFEQLGRARYRVDHFLPRDVGALVAYPFGLIGSHEAFAHGQD